MKALGDYIHEKGLKFGIYSSAGTLTCQQYPASLYNEKIDAADFAQWGVDYLKYDNCFNDKVAAIQRYTWMKDALNATGRPIFYSICNWGEEEAYKWGNLTGNSWRTTMDIKDLWTSMHLNFELNQKHPESAGPGGWNDPDMLEVGNGGMTHTEYVTHYALWSIIKAPLILGNDLSKLDEKIMSIIANEEVIAVNQDPLGIQGILRDFNLFKHNTYAAPLANGDIAAVIVNFKYWGIYSIKINFSVLGLDPQANYKIRDLWARQDLGVFQNSYVIDYLDSHASRFFRFSIA